MAELTAVLKGVEEGLEDALDDVAQASREVSSSLENLDETLSDISASMEVAEQSTGGVTESVDDLRNASAQATKPLDEVGDELSGVTVRAETANITVGQLGQEMQGTAVSAEALQASLDQVSDEASEASRTNLLLAQINDKLSTSNLKTAATSRQAASGIDEMGDEASETTGELIGTASAAELLSLQSSALSINVGAFTVALRNLTTQVPLLVASLGNLSAAFAGLGTAIGAAGIGGASLALGGLLAKAEEAGANLNDFGSVMKALGPTSQSLQEALIEAFRPVIEAEGAIALVDSLMQGLVDTVHSFSSVLAFAFEESFGETAGGDELQSLATTFSQIGASFQENIDAINQAFGDLVVRLGDDLAGITDSILSGLPGFIQGVTVATEEIINIIDVAGDSFGQFISEVSNLGRTIGAGLAPVLDSFFGVVADVAEGINSLGEDTLATAVKVGALILAVNRLGGVMGSLVTPVAQVTANLAKFATNADGFLQGFTRTIKGAGKVSAGASSGIRKLSEAFELVISPLGENTSVLKRLNARVRQSKGIFSRAQQSVEDYAESNRTLRDSLSGVRSSISGAVSRVSDFVGRFVELPDISGRAASAFESAGNDISEQMFALSTRMASFKTSLQDLDGVGDVFSALGGKISDVTTAIGDKFEVGVIEAIGQATDANRALQGFFSDAEQFAGDKSTELAESVNKIGSSIRDVIPSAQQMRSAVTRSLGAVLAPIGMLAQGFASVGGAAIEAGSKIRFFGGALRAATTGTVSDNFIQGLRERFQTGIIPDNIINLGPDTLNTDDISARQIRSIINNQYISPITESIGELGSRLSSGVGDTLTKIAEGPVDSARKGFMRLGAAFSSDNFAIDDTFGSIASDIREVGGSALRSIPGVEALESAMNDLRDGPGITSRMNNAFASLSEKIRSTAPLTGVLDRGFQGLIKRMALTGGVTTRLAQSMRVLRATMLGNMTLTNGLKAAIASLAGVQGAYSVKAILASVAQSAYAAATTLATAATTALLGVLGSLVTVLGVLTASLAVVVVLVGSVGAALAALGASGQDAESIMQTLMDTLRSIGNALMPAVVESSELMMDVFRSIAAPVGALVDGLKDIGIALGLIDESAASGGLMSMLRGAVSAFTPLLEQAGYFARLLGGELTAAIEQASAMLVKFIEDNNIAGMIDNAVAMFGSLFEEVMALQEPFNQFIGTITSSVVPVFQNILSSVSELGGIISSIFGGSGEGGEGFFNTLQMIGEAIIGLVAPALDLIGSVFSAIMGIVNAAIDVFMGFIRVVAGIYGFLNDALGAFISGLLGAEDGGKSLVGFLIDGFMAVIDVLGALMSGISTFIDVFAELFSMLSPIIGFLFEGIMSIANIVGGVLVGAFEAAGSIIRTVLTTILDAFNTVFGGIVDSLVGFVDSMVAAAQIAADAFTAVPDLFRKAWNNTIGGFELQIPSITLGSNIEQLPEMTIGGQSLTLPEIPGGGGGSGGSGDGDSPSVLEGSEFTEEDITSGAGTAAEIGKKGASGVSGAMGAPGNVNVEEGDTTNIFNQNISADPEDEAQMGRIAKDAMEEAESFKRRQQGSQ
jgi:phage-related protein